jgi:hypothetical protein
MAHESMTPEEKLWAARRLEKPHRVPVIPTLLPEPAAGLAELTAAQVAEDNPLALGLTLVQDEAGRRALGVRLEGLP